MTCFGSEIIEGIGTLTPHPNHIALYDDMFSPENVKMFKSIELCAVGLYLHTWKA